MTRKILAHIGSRADGNPLAPVIEALGESCEILRTEGLYGNEAHVLTELREHAPDIFLVLGDRIETLLAATLAASLAIPIAHIHGGEITEGSTDDSMRHAISKLSYYHFPSCELHADRLKQMGEDPENIFTFGAPGVDALVNPDSVDHLGHPCALVCYLPETLGSDQDNLNHILSLLPKYKSVFISGANADKGGKEINNWWQKNKPANAIYYDTYPQTLWIQLMRYADALIGNSSSFVIEGMTLGKKPIIIGDRQKGRYEDALRMFSWNKYAFGEPGTVAPKIAQKLLDVVIPDKPRKRLHGYK